MLGQERPDLSICSWLTHIIPCVVITPLGAEVEPDVNRIFASVSGPTAA